MRVQACSTGFGNQRPDPSPVRSQSTSQAIAEESKETASLAEDQSDRDSSDKGCSGTGGETGEASEPESGSTGSSSQLLSGRGRWIKQFQQQWLL